VASLPLLVYPCLNPWGLENNSRWDAKALDLNRVWNGSSSPSLISKIMKKLSDYTFSVTACLHEDYEGLGTYLYAPGGKRAVRAKADAILQAVQGLIPRDTRRSIDGRKCTGGMIFPRPSKPPAEGIPEALFLYENCGGVNFTLETPSELEIGVRAEGHVQMITEVSRP
jgi:protein MpaA